MINSKIKNIFLSSGELYVNNIFHVTSLCLFVIMVSMICNTIGSSTIDQITIQNLIFNLSSRLFNIGLSLGLIKIFLLLNNNKQGDIKTLFSSFDLIFHYFISTLIFGIILCIAILPGLIILGISSDLSSLFMMLFNTFQIIPNNMQFNLSTLDTSDFIIHNQLLFIFGIIIIIINLIWTTLRLQFYRYAIVDQECGSVMALKNSYAMTEGNTYLLLQFLIVLIIINLLGMLFFMIGLFVTIPFSMICMTQLYLEMKRNIL